MREVAVGILIRNSRVLVCQRNETARYPLKWEFPGGKLEGSETAVEALKRELKEELGIDAEIGDEFHRQEWQYDEGSTTDGHSFRIFYYIVPEHRGRISNNAFREIRWVTAKELPGLDLLDGNREAVNRLIRDEQQIKS